MSQILDKNHASDNVWKKFRSNNLKNIQWLMVLTQIRK